MDFWNLSFFSFGGAFVGLSPFVSMASYRVCIILCPYWYGWQMINLLASNNKMTYGMLFTKLYIIFKFNIQAINKVITLV